MKHRRHCGEQHFEFSRDVNACNIRNHRSRNAQIEDIIFLQDISIIVQTVGNTKSLDCIKFRPTLPQIHLLSESNKTHW